jgi:hypothetical protein
MNRHLTEQATYLSHRADKPPNNQPAIQSVVLERDLFFRCGHMRCGIRNKFTITSWFAAQCIPVIERLEIDPELINVNGGGIALGHPLGCTGAKLTVTLLHELLRQGGGYGIVTMCVGGGMGAAGVFEVL